eukprot:jgi/Ulvmu1/10427/UM062_0023.1
MRDHTPLARMTRLFYPTRALQLLFPPRDSFVLLRAGSSRLGPSRRGQRRAVDATRPSLSLWSKQNIPRHRRQDVIESGMTLPAALPLQLLLVASTLLRTLPVAIGAAAASMHGRAPAELTEDDSFLEPPEDFFELPGEVLSVVEGVSVEDFKAGMNGETEAGAGRSLLHGCHGRNRQRCRRTLSVCSRCTFRARGAILGHCRSAGRVFNCRRRGSGARSVQQARAMAEDRAFIAAFAMCPSTHAASWPGHQLADPVAYYAADYEYQDVPEDYVSNEFQETFESLNVTYIPQEFAAVATPAEFQDALRAGVNHIQLTVHLDMVDSPTVRDLRIREALNTAVGRVRPTTLSITGNCTAPPPAEFMLTEPMPAGACAVLVREDFLDAPLGTTCLLLDSLYVAVSARTVTPESSVLVLHVDGAMYITNCVLQGAGMNSRAIDISTKDANSTPSLYIKDSVLTGFTRSEGPGILAQRGSSLLVDTCAFRNITMTPPRRDRMIQASAIAAFRSVTLLLVNMTVENNVVLGEPAGDRAVAIQPSGTEVLASPQMTVWQWPNGPFMPSDPERVAVAEVLLTSEMRPLLEALLDIQREIVTRGMLRSERAPRAVRDDSRRDPPTTSNTTST